MHHLYFPACPVDGPIDPPVPYGHMVSRGAIPNKCGSCRFMFEGGCTRFMEKLHRYLHLDFGPCGIDGPTDPVIYETRFIRAKVEIPRKCAECRFLIHDRIRGFTCRKDEEKWGDCRRGLDWGSWSPERIEFQLPFPKVTTKALVDCVYGDDLVGFVKEHRRINSGIPMSEAKSDFASMRKLIGQVGPEGGLALS